VICVDEMGPVSAKSYAARRPSPQGERPRLAPDYGGRGSVWVYGGFEPATGQVFTQVAARRDTACFVAFLDALVAHWPQGEIILVLDNLSTHRSLDVQLWALAHERVSFLFQPVYAPWLNLIEPWWKTLRSLALKGRVFATAAAVTEAIQRATAYWNAHRTPFRWRKAYS
jgi:transposase